MTVFAAKKSAGQTNSPAAKKQKPSKQRSSSSSSDEDICIICMENLPRKLNRFNSIKCNTCKRPVHLKCATMTSSFFTCKHCETDSENED